MKLQSIRPKSKISNVIKNPNPSRTPPVINGLIGLYDVDSWTGSQWSDISGNGNHATTIKGTISVSNISGNGLSKTIPALSGGVNDGLRFPTTILPATYTLFHLTRSTGTNARIVTGYNNNWLSGHWGGNSGVAYHEGWLTSQTVVHSTNWVLSTDQNSLYRSNGVTRGTSGGSATTQLSINHGTYAEYSSWNCAFLAVYNRTLTDIEYRLVEAWIADIYGLNIPNGGSIIKTNLNVWYDPQNSGNQSTVNDLSGRSLNAAWSNTAWQLNNGAIYDFNGSSSYIDMPTSSFINPGTGDWSVETWVNPSSISGIDIVFASQSSNSGGFFGTGFSGGVPFSTSFNGSTRPGATHSQTLSTGVWYHIVGGRRSGTFFISVNGNIVNGSTTSDSLTSGDPRIGINPASSAEIFHGYLGPYRYYSKALTYEEIMNNFNFEKNRFGYT